MDIAQCCICDAEVASREAFYFDGNYNIPYCKRCYSRYNWSEKPSLWDPPIITEFNKLTNWDPMSPSSTPLAIDNFVVVKKIAESEWGEIFHVKPKNLDRSYALKLSKEGTEHRLILEQQILEKIGHHTNITQIYFAGEFNGRPYIVEDLANSSLKEYVDQITLLNKLTQRFLPLDKSLSIILQILEGLAFAHSKNIIHRDLKPENVLLKAISSFNGLQQASDQVLLCDFGLASASDKTEGLTSSLEDAATAAGTVQYLSPEQKNGNKITHLTDLYTTGLIFYELLTGKQPTINLSRPTELRPSLPTWVDAFILKAIKPDPQDRYQSAQDMIDDIHSSLAIKLPPPPSQLSLIKECFNLLTKKASNAVTASIKFIFSLPIYIISLVVFFPFAAGSYLINRAKKQGHDESPATIAFLLLFCGYYFWAVPEIAELYLKQTFLNKPAAGTICFYNNSAKNLGFTFVDAKNLPTITKVFIPTPEIISTEFVPKFTLSDDGKTFYYTTPTGLVKVNLASKSYQKDFLVKSEVFQYFTELAFFNGMLLARIKDETWHISSEGQLQQSKITLPTNLHAASHDIYEIEQSIDFEVEVQFNNYMLGNMDLGRGGLQVWFPQTAKLFE